MHWRGRQIFSQPRHPDLNVDLCLQRFLHPICFCGGRIPLVLEVRVEEEASLAQLWEHIKSQYLQITLWIKGLSLQFMTVSQEPRRWWVFHLGWAESTCLQLQRSSSKRENVLPSWIRLDGPDCVLGKMAPPWALLDLISKHKCAVISGLSPVLLDLQRKIFPTTRLGDNKQEQ